MGRGKYHFTRLKSHGRGRINTLHTPQASKFGSSFSYRIFFRPKPPSISLFLLICLPRLFFPLSLSLSLFSVFHIFDLFPQFVHSSCTRADTVALSLSLSLSLSHIGITVVLKEEKTRIREHKDREREALKAYPWVHHPERPITGQRPYYSW